VYSQITSSNVNSGSYNGNDQYPTSDIIDSGAVLIASLMTSVDWVDISSGLCESVAEYFAEAFTSQGVTVWLRFAHEMNYYSAVGVYPGGCKLSRFRLLSLLEIELLMNILVNYGQFMTAWQNMYNAIKDNDKIFMFWSPNDDTSSEPVAPWWPGKEYVDIVGMDYYPNADSGLPSFSSAYGNFYDTYALANKLPFAIGETGTQLSDGTSASTAQKEQWLKNIINTSAGFGSYSEYYVSCTWFEYGPSTNSIDYYVVYGQSASTVTETIANTENGS
jgi:Glycosyl hydrolase family 26